MKNKIVDNYYKGQALDAYDYFGAHPCVEKGCKGCSFYDICASCGKDPGNRKFDDWSCKGHQMKRKDKEGIWSIFVGGAKVGDMYKYRVTQATGRVVDKMDPYAFYSELRPKYCIYCSESGI